ncbi:MAG TPA: hypothetical protein VK957_23370 [Lunatimonas sp.]|nr:hypothetical protein [Lunatimonas sp.]
MLTALNTTTESEDNFPISNLKLSRHEPTQYVLGPGEALQQQGVKLIGRQAGDTERFAEVSFELSEKLTSLYGTLRGLSDLYRSPSAYIKSNHAARSFTLYFKADAKQEVKSFLELIFNTLDKELHFKKVLHKILSIQQRQEKENELIYKQLF